VGLPSGLLPSGFLPKTLYAPFISPIRATYPAYLRLVTFSVDLILLVILTQVLELLYFGRANRIRKTSEKWTADVVFNVSLNLKITGVSGSSSSMRARSEGRHTVNCRTNCEVGLTVAVGRRNTIVHYTHANVWLAGTAYIQLLSPGI
jgi:hypothetical protein